MRSLHLAVTDDVFDGVFLCCFFPRDVLDEIWDWIESVSEGFPTQSCQHLNVANIFRVTAEESGILHVSIYQSLNTSR